MLTFSADASADPSLIADTVVYQDDSRTAVKEYTRDEKEIIDMPAGDDYTTRKIGVLTYRGTAFRQNAAVGTVEDATQLTQVWAVETGSLKGVVTKLPERSDIDFDVQEHLIVELYSK